MKIKGVVKTVAQPICGRVKEVLPSKEIYNAGRAEGVLDGLGVAEEIFTKGYTTYRSLFKNNTSITTVPAELLRHTATCRTFADMFSGCSNLTTAPWFDTSAVVSFANIFSGCVRLEAVPELEYSKATNIENMFNGCKSLKELPPFDASAIHSNGVFYGCELLETIPFTRCDGGASMFSGCKSLKRLSTITSGGRGNLSNLFRECSALQTIEGVSFYNASQVDKAFYNCSALANITILETIRYSGLNFQYSPLLTHDSLISIINALYDYSDAEATYNITIGSTNLDKLTDEEKAVATAKGWTLT